MKAFQDTQGNTSSKRILSFICFGVAIFLAIVGVFKPNTNALPYVIAFISAGCTLQGIAGATEAKLYGG